MQFIGFQRSDETLNPSYNDFFFFRILSENAISVAGWGRSPFAIHFFQITKFPVFRIELYAILKKKWKR